MVLHTFQEIMTRSTRYIVHPPIGGNMEGKDKNTSNPNYDKLNLGLAVATFIVGLIFGVGGMKISNESLEIDKHNALPVIEWEISRHQEDDSIENSGFATEVLSVSKQDKIVEDVKVYSVLDVGIYKDEKHTFKVPVQNYFIDQGNFNYVNYYNVSELQKEIDAAYFEVKSDDFFSIPSFKMTHIIKYTSSDYDDNPFTRYVMASGDLVFEIDEEMAVKEIDDYNKKLDDGVFVVLPETLRVTSGKSSGSRTTPNDSLELQMIIDDFLNHL